MKIFFVLDETAYLPGFMSEFIKRTKDQVVGAAIATKMPDQSNLDKYFMKRWYCFHPLEILKLLMLKYSLRIKDKLLRKTKDGRYFALRSLFKDLGVDCFDVEYDIQKPDYLKRIRETQPDVIFSSNPLIFREEMLTLPKICCINRHFALLPAYKGLFAVFHAYAQGEKYTGCSIHLMARKIDSGNVLSQKKIKIEPGQTLHQLHQQCFDAAVDSLLEALDKIRLGDFTPIESGSKPSYYSWPTPEEWKLFRQRGGSVI